MRKVFRNLKIKVISPTGNSTGNGLLHSAVSNIKLAQYHTVKAMGTTYRELYKIHDLIQSGDVRSVDQFLTEHQVNVNEILQCKGIALLHLAVGVEPVEKSKECTELLLKHGADPNLCNEDGITPVHIAAIWGRVDNLKLLIGCGGDPGCKDLDGLSAFDYAAREQQWEVYDYLHNVEDQIEDTLGSPCAYTLDLERILVTTDQMVAEYEPIHNDKTWSSTCRKSEMVRDWCEKTSLVVNKLYPTIISDCITSDNDPPAWRSINYTKNTNLDLTADKASNDSNLNETFKTCLSKPIEISGIQPLQITLDESKVSKPTSSSKPHNQRCSIYENFSLPGSPSNITHKNYNSKTNLRKQSQSDSLGSELKILAIDSGQSLLTEESARSVDLDKAMAVAQNRTNEWLSSSSRSSDGQTTNNQACNTRRSSASSGVSSNLSSGSIVLANIEEEYKYEDKVEDVILIEKHLLVSSVILAVDDGANSPDETVISIASSLPPSVEYDNDTLRKELQQLGFNPGPIQNSNRTLYLKKLQTLKKNPIVVSNQGKTYSVELEKSLRTHDWMTNLSPYMELETKARSDFANPSKKWREGVAKTSFTYLLLDPRVTANLPAKATHQTPHESWVTFVNSIFYVGKGKRSRPYSHLYQALTLWKRDFTTSKDKKVQHILDIWSDKVGVVCLHIFQNVIPAEAYTYEASMIDVLGLQNLKNLKCGNYYGAVSSWPLKERRMLGLYLLYKAMLIFLSEGERQLRPDDID